MRTLPRTLLLLVLALAGAASPARAASIAAADTAAAPCIALTFDDGFDPQNDAAAAAGNAALLAQLHGAGVTAMLFPTGRALRSGEGRALVADWSQAGHAVGNHTWSHRSINSPGSGVARFERDVERAHTVLHTLPTFTPMLRFPYLKEGRDAARRDRFRAWMRAHGYRPAPVSVDASDWYYAERFTALRRAGRDAELPRLRDAYVAHLWDRACWYDSLARVTLGRSPKHVLLLHANALNAAWIGDVVAHFRAHGWRVVSPAEAFADPLYALQPDALPAGESIVWALARSAGATGLRYPAEDAEYERPKLAALGLDR